jgi:hypothetical protein
MREHKIPKPKNKSDKILLFCITLLSCLEQRSVLPSLQPNKLKGAWLAVSISIPTPWGYNTIKMYKLLYTYLNKHIKTFVTRFTGILLTMLLL